MILEEEQIIELIKADVPDFIYKARKKQVVLDVHVNGRGVAEYLEKINGYENETQFTLRKKHAMSNKFLISNLLRPVDRVFSAKGGSKVYNIDGEASKAEFQTEVLSNVRYGFSIRKWLQDVQANKLYSDPSGLVFVEIAERVNEEVQPKAYPTLKSIQAIKEYKTEGRSVDYVVFEPYKKKNERGEEQPQLYFRVVDDAYDYLFVKDGESVSEIEESRIENPWGRVPAIVNSDILNYTLKYSDSPLDVVVDLADKYLRTNSIKSVYEYLHGFPLFWMYNQKCRSCGGIGLDKNGNTCKSCKGTGAVLKRDVSDMLLLNIPKDKEDPILAPDVAGYVTPPLEIPKEQREELEWVWQGMMFALWGTSHEEADNPTATAATLNIQPQNDRLNQFTETFEGMEKALTDFLGEYYYQDNYNGSSINYGRRYIIESPDQIWKKYEEAKKNNAPQATLDLMLIQYYQSEFMNDEETLSIMIKTMKVEPFVHSTLDQVKSFITGQEIDRKVYFGEWVKTKNEQYLLVTSPDKMLKDLDKYIQGVKASHIDQAVQAASRFAEFGVGGVQGILQIHQSVLNGVTSREAALKTLGIIYGFDETQANEILGQATQQTN